MTKIQEYNKRLCNRIYEAYNIRLDDVLNDYLSNNFNVTNWDRHLLNIVIEELLGIITNPYTIMGADFYDIDGIIDFNSEFYYDFNELWNNEHLKDKDDLLPFADGITHAMNEMQHKFSTEGLDWEHISKIIDKYY